MIETDTKLCTVDNEVSFILQATLYKIIMLASFRGNSKFFEQYPPLPFRDNRPQLSVSQSTQLTQTC